ncbi:hypothetical protein [Burkholderia multivorans]|uniref:hypothetical protein n=1 Tax=Burkholderia multivorans TaxID=87883 RepID=UPI0020B1A2CD|nr:hypothetical protein [Burkholderia multivorans]MDN8045827.1 hypothetical protein [Burkholderia multivorans]
MRRISINLPATVVAELTRIAESEHRALDAVIRDAIGATSPGSARHAAPTCSVCGTIARGPASTISAMRAPNGRANRDAPTAESPRMQPASRPIVRRDARRHCT